MVGFWWYFGYSVKRGYCLIKVKKSYKLFCDNKNRCIFEKRCWLIPLTTNERKSINRLLKKHTLLMLLRCEKHDNE